MFIFVLSFAMYMLLVWSGGGIAPIEIVIGLILATILTISARHWSAAKHYGISSLNPLRWLGFLYYLLFPFMWALIKANLDVAMRVITGRIRPGIVKIDTGLKGNLSKTLLANSITLTPGTLTVDVEDDSGIIYIHWINVTDASPSEDEVYGSFGRWARRLAE